MLFDYSALRGKIVEKFGTNKKFAKFISMPAATLSMKLNNKLQWKQSEIDSAMKALGIDESDISRFFFCSSNSKF